MIVPVPAWPGSAAYPVAVATTTLFVIVPVMTLPFWVIDFDTAVPMSAGSEPTGVELPPGDVVHVPPQNGGLELGVSANPLKANGVTVVVFCVAHRAPQKVTVEEAVVADESPSVKMPRLGNAKTITLFVASADGA